MSESRIKIKMGETEFETEGPPDFVHTQFEAFRRLIAPLPADPVPALPAEPQQVVQPEPVRPEAALQLAKIMRLRGPIVSLSVTAKADDALLAILLGQKELRQNEVVNGVEIIEGLRGSGLRLKRADAILAKSADAGRVIAIGRFRSRRYRLSPAGIDRAQQIVRTLIAQAPQ